MAAQIVIFSITMGADYSFYVKSIATYAPTFSRYNNSVLAIVNYNLLFGSFFVVKDNKKKWTSITKSDHNLLLDFSTIIDMLQTAGTNVYIHQNSKLS